MPRRPKNKYDIIWGILLKLLHKLKKTSDYLSPDMPEAFASGKSICVSIYLAGSVGGAWNKVIPKGKKHINLFKNIVSIKLWSTQQKY